MNHFDASRMLSFDLETTGTNPHAARIVTSSLIRIEGSQVNTKELLADPGVDIPDEATAVHGITTAYAQEHGQPHEEVLAETIRLLRYAWQEDMAVIVFNAPYDLTVLRSLEPSFTVDGPVFDPLLIDRCLDRYRKGKRTLSALCEHYQIHLDNAHNSSADALAAARIAWRQVHNWPKLKEFSFEELMEYQAVQYYEIQSEFRAWRESKGQDSSTISLSWPVEG
ncbi:3'-5' exonuclease [Corynebacterium poyangense]|uniref:3'-5' exonuclease n=1 Tax=Corynebacterium poyangense TaxID=2684405 RepID=A0A7H0SNF4_9CORY|nr:3'-5' exonuclease [Corynebacterium poyangense]MBZ8177108.1 3'-5' exonuclease [Corynebacterium poyangense]QNQ90079.1 3'-5' exonuclease [Corynebacterium poyangense]